MNNSFYPTTVYPNFNMTPNTYLTSQYQPQTQNANIWYWTANAEEAVKTATVNPGSMVAFFDTESEMAFFKFIDTSTGKPVINKARLIFENSNKTNAGFATKEDFDILSKNIADLREEFDSLTIKRSKKKEDE